MVPTAVQGPLAGLRVVDATWGIAGPIATMLLGDFGAQVVRSGGDDGRAADELPGAVMWHRNKTIVPAAVARALAADADLVVTTETADAAAFGLPVDGPQPDRQVHLHLPQWCPRGTADPLTLDRMMQAEYGIARRQTSFGGGPIDCVYPFTSYIQGAWGATAAIAAALERLRTGVGQRVVVDPLHGAIVTANTTMFADPKISLPTTTVGPGGPNPAFGPYLCADGEWLFLGALGVKFQDLAFGLLGVTDITEHPRIAANREEIYAVDLRDEVRARIAEGFARKPREHWLAEFAEAGCPASPVGERDEWLDHPQLAALGQRVELADPVVGPAVVGGNPVGFSADPDPVFRPRVFADSAQWTDERPDQRPTSTAETALSGQLSDLPSGHGPLHGVRVLDLGTVLAGPYAGQLLASLGADVVKVETPKGDEFRVRGYMVNRGQRGLSVDLRDPRGHQAFETLVAGSHAVLDNFRPGVSRRLGVDLESLRAVNPDIVTTSITGYGGVGPLGTLPGYDPVVQALSGIMRAQGGDAEPVFCTVSVNDVGSACLAALGTCAALYQQAAGRGGQAVSTTLVSAATFMQSNELVRFGGRVPAERGGRDHPGPSAHSRYYRCADGWVRVHLSTTDAVERDLESAFAEMTQAEIRERVEAAGGIVARARDNKQLLFDPVTQEDGHLGRLVWPDGNESYLPRTYAAFGRYGTPPMMTTPGMGEHSREVLLEAGLSQETVDTLVADGVVVQGGPLHSVAGTGYR